MLTIPRFSIDKKMSEFRDRRPENIRPKMNVGDRAKQFAPFAALGHMDYLLRKVESAQKLNEPEHEKFLDDIMWSEGGSMDKRGAAQNLSIEEMELMSAEFIDEDGLESL